MGKKKTTIQIGTKKIIEIIVNKSFTLAKKNHNKEKKFDEIIANIIEHFRVIVKSPETKDYTLFKALNRVWNQKILERVQQSSLPEFKRTQFQLDFDYQLSFESLSKYYQKNYQNIKLSDKNFKWKSNFYTINYIFTSCGTVQNILRMSFDEKQMISIVIKNISKVNIEKLNVLELYEIKNQFCYEKVIDDKTGLLKERNDIYQTVKNISSVEIFKMGKKDVDDVFFWQMNISFLDDNVENNKMLFAQFQNVWRNITVVNDENTTLQDLIINELIENIGREIDIKKYYEINVDTEDLKLKELFFSLNELINVYSELTQDIFQNEKFYFDYVIHCDEIKIQNLFKVFRTAFCRNLYNLSVIKITKALEKIIENELIASKVISKIDSYLLNMTQEVDSNIKKLEACTLDKINQTKDEQQIALEKVQAFKKNKTYLKSTKKLDDFNSNEEKRCFFPKKSRVPKFQRSKVRDFLLKQESKKKSPQKPDPKTINFKKYEKYHPKLLAQENLQEINHSLALMSFQSSGDLLKNEKLSKKSSLDLIQNFPDLQESLISLDDSVFNNTMDWWINTIDEINNNNIDNLYEEINQKINHLDNKKRILTYQEAVIFEKITAQNKLDPVLLPIIILHRDDIRDKKWGRPAISLATFIEKEIEKELVIVGTTRKISEYQYFHQKLLETDTYFYAKDIVVITKEQNKGLWNETNPIKLSSTAIDELLTMITKYNEASLFNKLEQQSEYNSQDLMNQMWDNYAATNKTKARKD